MIIVVMGLPGTGKTYFAEHLAKYLRATHISSDKTRNRLQKRGAYSPDDKAQVYREMLVQAEEALKSGQEEVIMDATYSQKARRDEVMALAHRMNTSVHFIQLTADEDIIRERTSKKREDSEADFKVYQLIKKSFESLVVPHLKLDSGQLKIEEMLAIAQNYLTS